MLGVNGKANQRFICRNEDFNVDEQRTFNLGQTSIVCILETQGSGCLSLYVIGYNELYQIQGSKDYSSIITVGKSAGYVLTITPKAHCKLTIYLLPA